MSVDAETVKKIAHLARLAVSEEEAGALTAELNAILGFVAQLDEVDTEGVEPIASVVAQALAMRADTVTDGGIRDKILANAPRSEAGYFVVPKVVE